MKNKRPQSQSIGEMAAILLDPLMQKRVGLNTALFSHWAEIVGADIAKSSEPLKIIWPSHSHQYDAFSPGCLIIGCQSMAALKISHQTSEILSRINSFFGFNALSRIKVQQSFMAEAPKKSAPKLPDLSHEDQSQLADLVSGIKDDELQQALLDLGTSIYKKRRSIEKS